MPERKGFSELPTYDAALRRVLDRVAALGTESVALGNAVGRVLREPVVADRDQPPFDRSAMDGYAVRSADVKPGATYPVTGSIAAGQPAELSPERMTGVVEIATGAPVPSAYDAVVPQERAESPQPDTVTFDMDTVRPGANIHPRGADARQGDTVISAPTRLSARHLGIAASVGAAQLKVTRRPRVTVLTTGDEVRPANTGDDLQSHQIRNSNGPMLTSLVERCGGECVEHQHVADDGEQTLAAAREALSHSNLVITAGGVSVGARDHLPGAWQQLGLETLVHGVALQPGKPLLAAQPPDEPEKLVLGLPGNPVSALVTAHLFVWPVLRKMLGLPPALPWRRAWLATITKPNPRREAFRFVRYLGETREQVEVIPWQGSGDLAHTATADGLVRLPMQSDPLDPGAPAPLLELP